MYENILNAVKLQKLSSAQELENYDTFSKIQKEGIVLSDLMRKASEADELRKKLDELQSKPSVDADLLQVMESAVKDHESVKLAKRRVYSERERVLEEICTHDEGYRRAVEEYRTEVNRAYVEQKESKGVLLKKPSD